MVKIFQSPVAQILNLHRNMRQIQSILGFTIVPFKYGLCVVYDENADQNLKVNVNTT